MGINKLLASTAALFFSIKSHKINTELEKEAKYFRQREYYQSLSNQSFMFWLSKKETAVLSIALPFIYHGMAHFAVHLKNSHRKKEDILRWTAKKRKKFLDGQ